jgi:hypothetical protein
MKTWFRGVSRKLAAHVEDISAAIRHAGEQGASNERIITKFLNEYLPKRYAVGHGKILAHTDEDSAQIDVIVYDSQRSPPLYTEEGLMIAAVESVYGVVEVKTTLDKDEIADANNKGRSVLDKPRLWTRLTQRTPAAEVASEGPTYPPIACCFGFQTKTSLDAMIANLNELSSSRQNCLGLVCALDKGVLVPFREKWMQCGTAEDSLLYFLAILIEQLDGVPDRQFRLGGYM